MTEDRHDDGTGQGPGPEDSPSAPRPEPDPDEPTELEGLVPDDPAPPTGPDPLEDLGPASVPESSPQTSPVSQGGEAEDLRKQVEAKDAQLTQVMDAYRALKKETERLRKRIETHQKRRFEQSKNDFIGNFVEVLDNLDRAIDSIENNFDSDAVLEGIILVRSRLVQLLREEGLEKIFVGGQSFDPTHSEAAGIEPVGEPSQDNVVLKELQRGYMLKGALLRPARVIVGRYSHAGGDDANAGAKDSSEDVPLISEDGDDSGS